MSNGNVTPGPYKGEGVFCNLSPDSMDQAGAQVRRGVIELAIYNADVGGGRGYAPVDADGHFTVDVPGGMGQGPTATGQVNADCTELHAKLDYHNGFTGEIGGKVTPGKTSLDQCF
jgi:hypothetical protein